jgi:hypothetical protein
VELGHAQGARLARELAAGPLPWKLHRDLERVERVLEVGPFP